MPVRVGRGWFHLVGPASVHVAYLPSSPDYDGGFHACGLVTVSEDMFAVPLIINCGWKVPATESAPHQSAGHTV